MPFRTSACLVAVAALAACSNPDQPTGLTSASTPMTRAENLPASVSWRAPDVDATRYNSFIVSPVKIYNGADAKYGSATEADKQNMAAFMQQEFSRAIGERYRIATAPGPGTARLELTLAGLSGNLPVGSTVSSVLPIGLVSNVARGQQAATFSGSVTYKGDLYDAQTNKLLVSFITTKTPSPLDLASTVDSLSAQQAAITEGAKDARDAIQAAQQQAQSVR